MNDLYLLYIGQMLTPELEIFFKSKPLVRIQRPGMFYTQDYNFNRVNIVVGEDNIIQNVTNG